MTKAEYQTKYGALPPSLGLNKPKTTVAPIKMTRAEYEAKYGALPASFVAKKSTSYGEEVGAEQVAGAKKIGQSISKGAEDIQAGLSESSKGGLSTLFGAGKMVKGAAESAFGTISGAAQVIGAPFTPAIEKLTKAVTPALRTANPELAQMYDAIIPKVTEWAKAHPDAATLTGDIANTLLLAVGGSAAEAPIKSSLTKETAGQAVKGATEDILSTAGKVKEKIGGASFDKSIQEAKDILNPTGKYTPTEIEAMRGKGEVKTEGLGIFKKDVAAPKTTLQHETLADLVKEKKISASKTPQENINAISQEAKRYDSGIDELVNRPELNKPFTKATIGKVYDSVLSSAKKDLVFVSNSTEERAYNDVLGVAKEEIGKQPLNSAGLRKGIKAFNARMEKILGGDIYSGASESVGNAKITAAKDMRTALNKFLADNLESPGGKVKGGSVYQNQLQKEAMLLNAKDEIAYRSRGTLGKTRIAQKVGRFAKKHPRTTGALIGLGIDKAIKGLTGYGI